MIEEKLKLRVTNIKSVLVKNIKESNKISNRKSVILRKRNQRNKQKEAEAKVEGKKPKGGPIKSVFKNLGGMAVSFKDKILNFFGYLLMGFIVDKLPGILKGIEKTWTTLKPIFSGVLFVLSGIGSAMMGFVNHLSGGNFSAEKVSKELDEYEKELNVLDAEMDEDNLDEVDPPPEEPKVEKEPSQADIDSEPTTSPVTDTRGSVPLLTEGGQPAPRYRVASLLERNKGGVVEKGEQPKQQPAESPQATEKTNPLRAFPTLINRSKSPITEFSDNIDKLLSMGLGGGGGGTDALTEQAKVKTFGDTVKEVNRNWGFIGAEGTNYRTQKDYEGVYSVKDKIDDALLSLNNGVSPVRKTTSNIQSLEDENVMTITYIQPIEVQKVVPTVSGASSELLPEIPSELAQHIPIP